MPYHTVHETKVFKLQSSRLGDVIATHKADGVEIYFAPGDAGSEILVVVEECLTDEALDLYISAYFEELDEVWAGLTS